MERKTIEELGEEYERHALLQEHFIKNCRAQIEKAKKSGDRDAVKELRGKLQKLLEIKRELTTTAHKLKNYYKGED